MRKIGLLLLAFIVVPGAVLVVPANWAAATHDGSDVSVTRYGGADRYETSLDVAEAVAADAGGSLSSVVLVSGRRWTDAVVAAPVAGALGAPVLMTPPGELRADALAFLQRVGVSSAVVVGPDADGGEHGPGRGVGLEVLEALRSVGIPVERVAGSDRYGTAVAAAERVTPGAMGDLGRTAVIASGEVFADALVAGPFAARGIHPVLLTPPSELHTDVAGYLSEADIEHVVLMGGAAALSDSVERSVRSLDIDVSRVAGSTRYDTAVKAADLAEGRYSNGAGKPCFATSTIGLARARVPFDSFSAAPLLGRLCAPLVLADPDKIPTDTATFLNKARRWNGGVELRVFGGDAAVAKAAINSYLNGKGDQDADGEVADDAGDIEIIPVGRGISVTSTDQIILELQPSDVEPANLFDLSNRTLVFTPNGNGEYSRQVLPLQWDPNDHGKRYWDPAEIELQNFRFEFSGKSWSSFHLPPQGVITFGKPLPRNDLVRHGTIPMYAQALTETAIPAIGVLYKQGLGTAWRSVVELSDRVVITYNGWDWSKRYRGRYPEQTFDFQIVLHSDGRIAFNYGPNPKNPNEWIRDGVVGLFPTDPSRGVSLVVPSRSVDLSDADPQYSSQHLEAFRYPVIRNEGRGIADVSCRIIEVLGDEFDFLALNNQSRLDHQESGTASNIFRSNIQAEIQGTGLRGHGTTPCESKLKTAWSSPVWINGNWVVHDDYMRDGFDDPYDDGLNGFAHELSHVWLAWASYSRNGEQVPLHDDGCHCHWWFELHTPAPFPWRDGDTGSIQGGAFWREYPDGSFDRMEGWGNGGGGFSWLDLYLMGLATPDEVPDTFIVRDVQRVSDRQGAFTGTKEVITVEQVIAATGVRTPPAGKAPTVFNMGFVYVVLPGETVDPELLREHANYRDRTLAHWHHITGGRGQLTSALP